MIASLTKIFGKENVCDSMADKLAYGTDASRIEGSALAVVFPSNASQIQKLVRFAALHSLNLVPRGAGTGLAGAVVPQNSVVIDFSRMNRIRQINVKERSVAVEPGVVLDDLNAKLRRYDLFFPVMPSSHAVCTIGGMIAANASGFRAVKYGSTRKWVKELEVIDGTGKQFVISTKDIDDFTGLEGTTGIISKAVLKLTVPLKQISLSVYKFDGTKELVEKVKELKKTDSVSMEFIGKLTAEMLGLEKQNHLLVEFQDDSGEVKDATDIEEMEGLRDSAYAVLASKGYSVIEDPKLSLDALPEFIDWLQQNSIPSFGHVALGIIHPCFASDERLAEMYGLVKSLNGAVSGEHGFGIKKKGFLDARTIEKVSALKKRYDPNHIMNWGKIL